MRLIDADAMREDWLETGENEYVYDTNAVLNSIDAQPTVDAVPVVHGRWGNYDPYLDGYRCSRCKLSHRCCTPYCPNCGAKMDGGNEDGTAQT